VLQLNVDGLTQHMAEWCCFLQRGSVDVVLLQEWANKKAVLPNFSSDMRAAGFLWFPDEDGYVGILVKRTLAAQLHTQVRKKQEVLQGQPPKVVESLLAVSLLAADGGSPLVLASYYRNPAGKGAVPALRTFCDRARRDGMRLVIGGDFNAVHLMWCVNAPEDPSDARWTRGSARAGRAIAAVVDEFGLVPANSGEPTHFHYVDAHAAPRALDVTFYHGVDVQGWTVDAEDTFITASDHRTITFAVPLGDNELLSVARGPPRTG